MGLRSWIKGLTGTVGVDVSTQADEPGRAFDLLFTRPQPPAVQTADALEPVLLDIRNRFSSTEHYYHFVLGFLAPLSLSLSGFRADRRYLIRSCGPMDEHVKALGISNIEILSKQEFALRLKHEPGRAKVMLGYDAQAMYDGQAFGKLRDVIIPRLGINRQPCADILLVNRGKSPEYYQSEASEVKTSANLRRSIPNIPELGEAMLAAGLLPSLSELENVSLSQQVALFANARGVVAQHGAALVNMVWMTPGSVIVEINPKGKEDPFVDCFRDLARVCGHHYIRVPQESTHAAVAPRALLDAMRPAFPDMLQTEIVLPGSTPPDNTRRPAGGWPPAAIPVSRMHMPAWKGRFEKTCALLAARDFDLIWMGDSIVQQFETGGPDEWQDYVPVWNAHYRPRNAINLGFAGDDTTNLLWRLLNGHLNLGSAKLIILLIGTNNFGATGFGAEETATAILRMVDLIADRCVKAQVAVLSLIPNGRGGTINAAVAEVNARLHHSLSQLPRATFIDLSNLFMKNDAVDLSKFRDTLQHPSRPAIHPTAAAQAEIALRLEPLVTDVFKRSAV